jgi:hypothetical protein
MYKLLKGVGNERDRNKRINREREGGGDRISGIVDSPIVVAP